MRVVSLQSTLLYIYMAYMGESRGDVIRPQEKCLRLNYSRVPLQPGYRYTASSEQQPHLSPSKYFSTRMLDTALR